MSEQAGTQTTQNQPNTPPPSAPESSGGETSNRSTYTGNPNDGGGRDLSVNVSADPSYSQKREVGFGSTGQPSPQPEFVEKIPEEYRAKPYMEGINSFEDLMKQFDNAQSLIGKRPYELPHENSPQEKWDEFYNKLGRPESPDKYEFKNPELPEGVAVDENVDQNIKSIFHEAGLTNEQANAVRNKYLESVAKQQQEQEAQLDQEFDKLGDQVFGDRKDEALESAKGMIAEYIPENMKDAFQNLDNKSLMILAGVLDGVKRDYGAEDTMAGESRGPVMSAEDRKRERQALLNHPAMKDEFHPEHDAIKEKWRNMF
jgi:hypothetical protein